MLQGTALRKWFTQEQADLIAVMAIGDPVKMSFCGIKYAGEAQRAARRLSRPKNNCQVYIEQNIST